MTFVMKVASMFEKSLGEIRPVGSDSQKKGSSTSRISMLEFGGGE